MPIPAGTGVAPVVGPLTLTYDDRLSRVRIAAAGIPGGATVVTVERSVDQTRWTPVRGGTDVAPTGGVVQLDDYEFTPGVTNYYRLRAYTAAGREVGPAVSANPFFEADDAGWAASNATIARSTVQAHEGAASLLITPNGTSAAGGANTAARAPAAEGLDYLAALWVRTVLATTVAPAVDWHTAVSGGTYINTAFVPAVSIAAGSWTSVWGVLTAPAGALGAHMRARHSGTPTSGQAYWVDEVQLHALDAGPVLAGSITPTLDGVWLKSLARPFLNRMVTVRDFGEVTRPSRAGVHDVVGRSDPVAVTDIRGSRQWQLLLNTYDREEADDLDLLLASGDILLVHVPPNAGRISAVPGGYVTVGDTREITPPTLDLASRVFELPCKVVAAPGPDVVGATSNWQTVLNEYATWADLLAAHASWASVLELVGDPTDVVVD